MKHSIYIRLAVWLIRADIYREERALERKIKRSAHDIPWDNPHLLRDIGLESDGRPINRDQTDVSVKSASKVAKIRQKFSLRIPT
ncbi:DUF1127 domain-containing protein [Vibrio salinus]|uniref:DUF1127 domain-containing protein n=1 Tax=Vibrio salinus TaxID=2899784 RepID=UPI001E59583C|nr:DUF1127 domain-containing protein [Vibrio salinus]MCE0495713.1 DUF1127 domain-containing protein [Vibrio salinus]